MNLYLYHTLSAVNCCLLPVSSRRPLTVSSGDRLTMLSFFRKGDQKKQPGHGGPVVRRVITKKPIPPKPPAATGSSVSTPSRPSTSSSSSYKNGSSSTPSSRPKTQISSVKGKEKAIQRPITNTSSPVKRPIKRKIESARIESESESESSSGEDATALFGSTKKAKHRIGTSSTPRPVSGEEHVGRDRTIFRYRGESEAGEWEGFTPGEEIVQGVRKGWENKGDDDGRVRSLLDKYAACTSHLGDSKIEWRADGQTSHKKVSRSRIHFLLLNFNIPQKGVGRSELAWPSL